MEEAAVAAEDLSGQDLRGENLRGRILREADLGGANLSGQSLNDLDLSGALGSDARWAVLCALYTFLPNVRPGKDELERLTGLSRASVWRAVKGLKVVGLLDYDDANKGGSRMTNSVWRWRSTECGAAPGATNPSCSNTSKRAPTMS